MAATVSKMVKVCFAFTLLALLASVPVLFASSSLAVGHPTPPSAGAKIPRAQAKIPSGAKSKQTFDLSLFIFIQYFTLFFLR
jgi:hypothetical protein